MISILLAKQIAELFLMILMGFLTVKTGVLRAEESRALSMVALYLIAPCVIIHAFQVQYSESLRNGMLLALAAAVLLHIVLLLLGKLLERLFRLNAVEKASIIYSNCGNLIIPLVTAVLGEEWLIYSAVFIAVQTIFLWTHCRMVLCEERHPDWKKILLNINMLTIALGILFFVTRIQLPQILTETMKSVSIMIGPVCMIVTGMLMATMDFRQIFAHKRIYLMIFLKMLLCPGITLLLLKYGGLGAMMPNAKMILLTSLLAVAAPSASTVTQMSQVYGGDAEYASAISVSTTLVCIATMPVMVWLYQR